MGRIEEAWNSVDSKLISNRWRNVFELLSARLLVHTTRGIESELRKTVQESMRALSAKFKKIGVERLLKPANKYVFREDISFWVGFCFHHTTGIKRWKPVPVSTM